MPFENICGSWSANNVALLLVFWGSFSPAELYKMVCDPDETDLDIKIPAVMLPQDAGATLEKMLSSNSSGKHFSLGYNA